MQNDFKSQVEICLRSQSDAALGGLLKSEREEGRSKTEMPAPAVCYPRLSPCLQGLASLHCVLKGILVPPQFGIRRRVDTIVVLRYEPIPPLDFPLSFSAVVPNGLALH